MAKFWVAKIKHTVKNHISGLIYIFFIVSIGTNHIFQIPHPRNGLQFYTNRDVLRCCSGDSYFKPSPNPKNKLALCYCYLLFFMIPEFQTGYLADTQCNNIKLKINKTNKMNTQKWVQGKDMSKLAQIFGKVFNFLS